MSAPIIWIDFNNIHVNIWETSLSLEETLNARDKTQLTCLLLINLVSIQKKIFHTKNMQLLQIKCTSQYTFIIKWLFSILKHKSTNIWGLSFTVVYYTNYFSFGFDLFLSKSNLFFMGLQHNISFILPWNAVKNRNKGIKS